MRACLGDQELPTSGAEEAPPHRFSAAHLPPLMPVMGYAHTAHAAKHLPALLSRVPPHLRAKLLAASKKVASNAEGGATIASGTAPAPAAAASVLPQPPVLGSSPWEDWPVYGPDDCSTTAPLVATAWDAHMSSLKLGRSFSAHESPVHDGGWGYFLETDQLGRRI
jgi:hypothetical protein